MNSLFHFFGALSQLAERCGDAVRWAAPAIARLTVGLVFFWSGWGKLNDLESVTGFFAELGLPMPGFQALLASTSELVCGGLLVVGLASRLAALPLIVVMIVAIRTALWDQVDGLTSLVGLLEFAYIALLVVIATYGPGPLSLDAVLTRATRVDSGAASPLPTRVAA